MNESTMFSYKRSQFCGDLPSSHMHHGYEDLAHNLHNMYVRKSIPESFLLQSPYFKFAIFLWNKSVSRNAP